MVSVCMSTKNGSRYVGEQLESILSQLQPSDEIVISDDASNDDTVPIIEKCKDKRIRILRSRQRVGIVASFERALTASKGGIIFLADQDDVWLPGKVNISLEALKATDLVVSLAQPVDKTLRPITISNSTSLKKGLIQNLYKNSYMGCCMAFRRSVLEKALPFPKDIPMHDAWIGLVSEIHFRTQFIPEILVLHRRHENNASTTGMPSKLGVRAKFINRYNLLKNLIRYSLHAA